MELKNRIINEVLHKPTAYIEVIDVDGSIVTLASCTRFNISLDRDDIMGSFSCTIAKAQDWNPRNAAYLNLFNVDKRKRIKIYYGQNISGTITYVKIFTGIITKKPETYSFGGSDYITLSGSNLGYLLSRLAGTYITPTFTGTSKTLLEYWLNLAGLDYTLSYTDSIFMIQRDIAYSSALTGFHSLKLILGPDKEAFFDAEGLFTYRDTPSFSLNEVEFVYNQTNIIALNRSADTTKIVTKAEIVGDSSAHSVIKTASDTMITKYGVNSLSRNNGLIDSYEKAENLADAILDIGSSYENIFDITAVLNPYLTTGSFITVEDTALSATSLTQVRAFEIEHSYEPGSSHQTTIKCYSE
jgi:hypothetical protein